MAGMIESTILPVEAGSFIDETLAVIVAVRTELILFCLAFLLHQLIFGSAFPRAVKHFRRKKIKCDSLTSPSDIPRRSFFPPQGHHDEIERNGNPANQEQALLWSQQAVERGDHKLVLRLWNTLRKSDQVPAVHVAQVLEAMQRFKKESSAILTEVEGYLRRNKHACQVSFVNQLLETIAKSLDVDVVHGLLALMESLDIKANSCTYELLLQMHFTTRNFQEVDRLSEEMQSKQIMPTARTSLILLKASLQAGNLEESLRRFKELSLDCATPTASQAPKHIMTQLVELACRERRVEVVLAELDAGRIPLTAEMVNTMLAESARLKDLCITEHVKKLVAAQRVELNSRSYQHLIRMAGSDQEYISQLLTEMQTNKVECLHDIATSVLSTCTLTNNKELANQLCNMVCSGGAIHAPTLLALVRFYAENGEAERACAVYDEHQKLRSQEAFERRLASLDSKTEKCLISAAMQCGRKDIASELIADTPSDTGKHIGMIRNSASKGDLAEALKIFDSLEAGGADLTHSLYNSLLDACVECSDLGKAETLMEKMVAAGKADAVSYNTLIKAHLKNTNYAGARSVMEKMQKAGCKPNPVTYNELINSLVQVDTNRAEVWEVIDEMRANGVRPNKVTCSILFRSLKSKSSNNDVMRTMQLTDQMEEAMDEVLMSSIIEACVRIGKPSLLTEKLEQLQGKNGIKVTGAHTFGSLIKAYGTARDMEGAWRCWKAMRSQHVKPTSITIGCMVEAVVSNGDVEGGYELICQLVEDEKCKSQINSVMFGSVLKGFARTKQMDRMWAVFKDMLSKGVAPSVVTFNTVINSCVSNNQIEAVGGLLKDMKARGLEPNLITFSTIIKGVCQRGDMDAAFLFFQDLKRTPEVKPDEIVYNTMLDGCANAGLVAEGEQLLEQMQKDRLTPTNYTLTVMVRLMGQGRRLTRAFELIDIFAKRHKVKANSHVFTALVQACLSCKDLSRAATAMDQSLSNRIQPDQRACQTFVRTFITAGKADYAVNILRALLNLPGSTKTNYQNSSMMNDAFINEVVGLLLESSSGARALAPPLVADIRLVRPKLQLEPTTDRNITLALVRNQSDSGSSSPIGSAPKKHPWSK